MKKFLLFLLITLWCNTISVFASESLEHFTTEDGQHFCSIFMKKDFKSCSEFWITYDGNSIISGKEPSFTVWFSKFELINIDGKNLCIHDGKEFKRIEFCTQYNSYFITNDGKQICGLDDKPESFKPCVDFEKNIISDTSTSVYLKKSFSVFPKKVVLWWDIFCIKNGKQINPLLCDHDYNAYYLALDGKHMCWVFKEKDLYRDCEELWITFDTNGNILSWSKPFFDTDGIVMFWDKHICVQKWKEVEKISDCDGTTTLTNDQGSFQCTTKDWIEVCTKDVENESSGSIGSQVLNTATCTLNGKNVDCAEMTKTAKSWFNTGLWTLLFFGILFLIGGIFWLVMLIHALSNPIPNKILWVAVIFFVSFIGAVIYYFVIKRSYTSIMVPNANTQQPIATTSPIITTTESFNTDNTSISPNQQG